MAVWDHHFQLFFTRFYRGFCHRLLPSGDKRLQTLCRMWFGFLLHLLHVRMPHVSWAKFERSVGGLGMVKQRVGMKNTCVWFTVHFVVCKDFMCIFMVFSVSLNKFSFVLRKTTSKKSEQSWVTFVRNWTPVMPRGRETPSIKVASTRISRIRH